MTTATITLPVPAGLLDSATDVAALLGEAVVAHTTANGEVLYGRVRPTLDPAYYLVLDFPDGRWTRTDVGTQGGELTLVLVDELAHTCAGDEAGARHRRHPRHAADATYRAARCPRCSALAARTMTRGV